MLFNSPEFIFGFLPITLLVFIMLVNRDLHRHSLLWLVFASLFFYGWWKPVYLILISCSIIANYLLGRKVCALSSPLQKHSRRILLILGIAGNLASIIWFKYAGFFASNINTAFNINIEVGSIILPLAISFYTFQQIAYLVDAYRGETEEHNFLNYALFVTFFPQLIAGPIVSHKEMLPQFLARQSRQFNYTNLSIGITLFAMGLMKKVVLADGVAVHANAVFEAAANGHTLSFLEAWTGSLAYTLQLYFDFSGYSDMALGLARIFGIRLPLNFNSPYKASSIIDFWRRWHITLSRFLREYLYFSIGGNRKGVARRYTNLFLTMLLGGLWHGAAWTFIGWGALHGIYLIINHGWRNIRRKYSPGGMIIRNFEILAYRILTFLAIIVGWVYFRAENVEIAHNVLTGMSGLNGFILPVEWQTQYNGVGNWLQAYNFRFEPLLAVGPIFAPLHDIASLTGALSVNTSVGPVRALGSMIPLLLWVWFAPNTQQFLHRFKPALESFNGQIQPLKSSILEWKLNKGWALITALIAAYSIFGTSQTSQFLYFNF